MALASSKVASCTREWRSTVFERPGAIGIPMSSSSASSSSFPPSPSQADLAPAKVPYALIETMECVLLIDLCRIAESFLAPADIRYRCHFEGWQIPPTNTVTADECLLHFAGNGEDIGLNLAMAWGATRFEGALRVAAKHDRQSTALTLVMQGALKSYQEKLLCALELGCAELRRALDDIDTWCLNKIRNTMLFFKWKWLNDGAFRDTYCTEEVQNWLDENEDPSGPGKNLAARELADPGSVWKRRLTYEQKMEMRSLYREWRAKLEEEDLARRASCRADIEPPVSNSTIDLRGAGMDWLSSTLVNPTEQNNKHTPSENVYQ